MIISLRILELWELLLLFWDGMNFDLTKPAILCTRMKSITCCNIFMMKLGSSAGLGGGGCLTPDASVVGITTSEDD